MAHCIQSLDESLSESVDQSEGESAIEDAEDPPPHRGTLSKSGDDSVVLEL